MKYFVLILALLSSPITPIMAADVKISALPLESSPIGADYFPLVHSGTTSRSTLASLPIATLVQSALDLKANQSSISNINNTSDANKPVSTAQQAALDLKENLSNKSTSTSLGASNTLYPSQNAVKTYVDAGDATKITGVASSILNEMMLFADTSGKLVKRATGTGFAKLTSGVLSTSATVNAATELTGISPVANGGTGTSTAFTSGRVVTTTTSGVYAQDTQFNWDATNNLLGVGGAAANAHLKVLTTSGFEGLRIQRPNAATDDFMNLRDTSGFQLFKVDYQGHLCIGTNAGCDGGAGDGINLNIGVAGPTSINTTNLLISNAANAYVQANSNAGSAGLYAFSNTFDFSGAGLESVTGTTNRLLYSASSPNGLGLTFEFYGANIANMGLYGDYLGTVNIGANIETVSLAEAQMKIEPTYYNTLAKKVTIHHRGGAPIIDTNVAQPACASVNRGQIWIVQGGAGVADIFQICQKTALDTYLWVTH